MSRVVDSMLQVVHEVELGRIQDLRINGQTVHKTINVSKAWVGCLSRGSGCSVYLNNMRHSDKRRYVLMLGAAIMELSCDQIRSKFTRCFERRRELKSELILRPELIWFRAIKFTANICPCK
jgi:hypothetical protein